MAGTREVLDQKPGRQRIPRCSQDLVAATNQNLSPTGFRLLFSAFCFLPSAFLPPASCRLPSASCLLPTSFSTA